MRFGRNHVLRALRPCSGIMRIDISPRRATFPEVLATEIAERKVDEFEMQCGSFVITSETF